MSAPPPTKAQTPANSSIIIEEADGSWTGAFEPSTELANRAASVTPRTIAEYANSVFSAPLLPSDLLNQIASAVTPRVIAEYANSIFSARLLPPDVLNQLASAVTPRIIAEYANSVFGASLLRSGELDQVASVVSPRIIVEYANAIFDPGPLERPSFEREVSFFISGHVADERGGALSGVRISTSSGRSATTNASGYYTFTGLITGTYILTPSKSGYSFIPITCTVEVPPSWTGQDFTGTASGFTYMIQPVYPSSHATPSTVMRGGTAYRHFRLLNAISTPLPNATVAFSVGGPATTDVQGYFTYTVSADTLGGPGATYPVSVQSVTTGGQTYPTGGQPTFGVAVSERRYSYAWSYGASMRAKGGVSDLRGVIAYLQGKSSGGLELKLDESDPNVASDDILLMKEQFSDELGVGGGVGIEGGVSVLILQVKGGAQATEEYCLRTLGQITTRFPHPYQSDDKKAEAIFLLASTTDSISQVTFPGKPFAINFLKLALARYLPYGDYISEQQAALGSKITPRQANVGAGMSLGLKRGGALWKSRVFGFDLVDVGVSVVQMNMLTDYRDRNEWGLGFESEHDLDWSLLSLQIWDFRNKLTGTVGDRAKKTKVELIFDSNTNAFKRLELSFTGEGNRFAFTDVLKEEVTVKLMIPADQLGSSRLQQTVNILRLMQAAQGTANNPLRIGPSAMVNELNSLLDGLSYAEYEVTVEDGAETQWETELGVTAEIKIELGPGLSVKKVRSLVRERGVFLSGHPYKGESYAADGYVSRPGKSWGELTLNALSGLWEYVKDAFSWVWQRVTSGVGWIIGSVSRTWDGIIRGGAQITAPSGTQLYVMDGRAQATDTITVTLTSWVPTGAVEVSQVGLRSAAATASGDGFVVGGIYEFQPYTLTVSPAATLIITYTDEAGTGVDESHIRMFRWNPDDNNWQAVSAQADLAGNIFTATITQLGTFALGYDSTPPQVAIVYPADKSTITNTFPLISALIVDTGVGVDPASVRMQLDGQVVPAAYITGTGELSYLPGAPLASGPHTTTVSVADVVGNTNTVTATFTTCEPAYTVDLSLHPGWNLISFNLQPMSGTVPITRVHEVLAPIDGAYDAVLTYDGGARSYYPSLPPELNDLKELDPYHGYWIRMTRAATLILEGMQVPVTTTLALRQGWNLVSYLPESDITVTDALASIAEKYSAVLGFHEGAAVSYYPSLPPELNDLKCLRPGHGYWIHMKEAGTLVYPATGTCVGSP